MLRWFSFRQHGAADFLDPNVGWPVREAKQWVRRTLTNAGWLLTEPLGRMGYLSSFLAARLNVRLAVMVSGTDSQLVSTKVKDLAGEAKPQGLVPVFVCGEMPDPRATGWMPETSVLLHVSDIARLDQLITSLPPILQGSVDHIKMPDILSGWAKVTPSATPALVQAWYEEKLIGESLADQYRKDLLPFGDGCFGFTMKLTRQLDHYGMFYMLAVRASQGGRDIGRIQFWNKATIVQAPDP